MKMLTGQYLQGCEAALAAPSAPELTCQFAAALQTADVKHAHPHAAAGHQQLTGALQVVLIASQVARARHSVAQMAVRKHSSMTA